MNWMGTTGCLLIVIAGTHHASAQSWGWFGPSDYEECAEKAAKEAPTRDGLAILLNSCQTKFEARRNPKGAGYVYYDSRMQRWFDVNGPTLSAGDKRQIEEAYQQQLKQEKDRQEGLEREKEKRRKDWAEYQVRQGEATRRVHMTSRELVCAVSSSCLTKIVAVNLKNESAEKITGVTIGWAFLTGAQNSAACPLQKDARKALSIDLPPGGSTSASFETTDGPADRQFRYCLEVVSVDLDGKPQGNWWDEYLVDSGSRR